MEKLIGSTPGGTALATTAVLVVLLEQLISSGDEARNDLEPYKGIVSVTEAVGLVGKLAARLKQNPTSLAPTKENPLSEG